MQIFLQKLTIKKKLPFLLLFFLLFVSFTFPKIARADVIGAAVESFWEYIDTTLGSLDFTESLVINLLGKLLFFLLLSDAFLAISAGLLEWVINQNISLGIVDPNSNPLVSSGWHFVLGLANLFFILIFVFIALSYILRIETFQAKKSLPRLIIVALLVNFSLIFVGFFVDVSQIFFKGIVNSLGGNLFSQVIKYLSSSVKTTAELFGTLLGGMIASAFVPMANIAAQGAILGIVITLEIFQGFLSHSILMIIINILLGGIFLLYFVLFLMRIAIIWILAIGSPIAFLCWILPQTEKYWNQWFHYLIEWLILGIVVIFLSLLGLRLFAKSILDWGGPIMTGIDASFKNYIFIIVYFGVVLYLSRKYTPQLANTLLSYGSSLTRQAVRFSKPFIERVRRGTVERIATSERIQKWAQRQAMAERRYGIFPAATRRAVGRALGPALIEAERRYIDEIEKKVSGQRIEAQIAAYRAARTDKERIAILNAMIKDKNIDDAMDVKKFGTSAITRAEIERLYTIAQDSYNKHQLMRAAFPEIARTYLPPGVPPTPPPPGITPEQHRAQYVFDRIRPTDYENMSRTVLSDNEFLEAMIRRGTDRHIHRFIDRFQMDGAIAFERRLRELADAARMRPEQFLRMVNPRLYRYFTRGAGQGLIHI